jgi:hypothetical protein
MKQSLPDEEEFASGGLLRLGLIPLDPAGSAPALISAVTNDRPRESTRPAVVVLKKHRTVRQRFDVDTEFDLVV